MENDIQKSGNQPAFGDKPGRRLPKSSIKILKRWYLLNAHNPRPTDSQKQVLEEETGLTGYQISNWFANARRRGISKSIPVSKLSGSQPPAPITIPQVACQGIQDSSSPLERWRNSPPEEEPASMTAIAKAVATSNNDQYDTSAYAAEQLSQMRLPRTISETSFESMSSFWTTGSSSNAQSDRSGAESAASNESFGKIGRKIHRRRSRSIERKQPLVKKAEKQNQFRPFQCTFCTDTFKTKYDWTRHEGSLHLVLEKWTCTPNGPTYCDPESQLQRCAFCDETNPSVAHVSFHDHQVCVEKSLAERSFRRKDHLRQHLRLVHGVDKLPLSVDHWKSMITHVQCRCGFCDEQFDLWSDRNDHVSEHFRKGWKMKDWKGDRGLVGVICRMVENAMPPYLIGQESNEMEPFSASRATEGQAVENVGLPKQKADPTRFQDLTAQLAKYVDTALREGQLVNDETIRKQARLIMFGDDDAWNQTPADNVEWLRLFRNGLGLGTATTSVTSPVQYSDSHVTTSNQTPITPKSITSTATSPNQLGSTIPGLPAIYDTMAVNTDAAISHNFWIWQSPECLVDFRHLEEEGHVPLSQNQMLDLNPSVMMDQNIEDIFAATFPYQPGLPDFEHAYGAVGEHENLNLSSGFENSVTIPNHDPSEWMIADRVESQLGHATAGSESSDMQ